MLPNLHKIYTRVVELYVVWFLCCIALIFYVFTIPSAPLLGSRLHLLLQMQHLQ